MHIVCNMKLLQRIVIPAPYLYFSLTITLSISFGFFLCKVSNLGFSKKLFSALVGLSPIN